MPETEIAAEMQFSFRRPPRALDGRKKLSDIPVQRYLHSELHNSGFYPIKVIGSYYNKRTDVRLDFVCDV